MAKRVERALDVWVWIWLCLLALLLMAPSAEGQNLDQVALEKALFSRMVVWKTPKGKSVTIRHCGSESDCKERIHLFSGWIKEAALNHGLDAWVLGAMALHESGMNPMATGNVGERGIFQLHPKGQGRDLLFVKDERARALCQKTRGACQKEVIFRAATMLKRGLEVCKDLPEALGYYNSGRCQTSRYSERISWQKDRLKALAPRMAEGPEWCRHHPPAPGKSSLQSILPHCEGLL